MESNVYLTKSGEVTTGDDGISNVVFATGCLGSDYSITLSCQYGNQVIAYFSNKTELGFRITTRGLPNGLAVSGVTVSWHAANNNP